MCIRDRIVELHGGQVGLTSQLGVGTTVVLWIPVLGQAVATPAESVATAS